MIKIGIVGYNLGNQDSLYYVLKSLGFSVKMSKKTETLSKSDIIILPGVGAFPQAMNLLKKNNLIDFLVDWASQNKPIVGICLGMQLLCTKSYEFHECSGLNIIDGEIVPLKKKNCHIGWNNNLFKVNNFYEKLEGDYFYFNHSYKMKLENNNKYAACNYGEEFLAAFQ